MRLFILFWIILLYKTSVYAETIASIEFSATIEKGCGFKSSSVGLDFGEHPTTSKEMNIQANVMNDQSSWGIQCTPNIPVSLSFGNGAHYSAATQQRRLKSNVGNFYIGYSIYKDNAHTQIIGGSSPSNALSLNSPSSNNMLNFGVYGKVDLSIGDENKVPGRYSDEILITITW